MSALPNENDFSINITHLPTREEVTFAGWVTQFSDNFSSTWNEVQVYGRMDPLSTFQNTRRKITISFDVVAGSAIEAYNNDLKMNRLIQFLYPVYDRGAATTAFNAARDQSILAAAPLLKVQFANLMQSNVTQEGLVCYLESVDYNPNINAGQFFAGVYASGQVPSVVGSNDYIGNTMPSNTMFYQEMSVNLSFTVLHTHLTGWVKGADNTFYFGADPNSSGASRYLGNFPHGGTSNFNNQGRRPAREQIEETSVGTTDPTVGAGADADVAAAAAGEVLGSDDEFVDYTDEEWDEAMANLNELLAAEEED